ncbi:MAG TPA: hypothetical protein VHQ24_08060 [Lachnospiraceae bacterium]|nr:hypothetical protein [Lachnospiraceae bacterium]
MECKICGRKIGNENANFCEYCGNSLKSGGAFEYQQSNVKSSPTFEQDKQEDKPIQFKTFFGIMILPLIPVFGLIVYIVVLFLWGFGNQYSETQKNFARASLVMGLLSVILIAAFFANSFGL